MGGLGNGSGWVRVKMSTGSWELGDTEIYQGYSTKEEKHKKCEKQQENNMCTLGLAIVQQAMLHFIYRDELNEDELAASSASSESCVADALSAKLLAAADAYDLCRLKRMCESRICKDISVSSVGRILALADTYHAMELKAICLRFASENLAAVMRSDGFEYLKTNHPALQSEILKSVAGCEEGYSSGDVNK
ncbi:hypothetical protein R6Q57_025091 [Mikania cordata]